MGGCKTFCGSRHVRQSPLLARTMKVGVWSHPWGQAKPPWLERVENDVGFHPTLAHVPHALSGPDINQSLSTQRARDDPGTARTQGSTASNPTDGIVTPFFSPNFGILP